MSLKKQVTYESLKINMEYSNDENKPLNFQTQPGLNLSTQKSSNKLKKIGSLIKLQLQIARQLAYEVFLHFKQNYSTYFMFCMFVLCLFLIQDSISKARYSMNVRQEFNRNIAKLSDYENGALGPKMVTQNSFGSMKVTKISDSNHQNQPRLQQPNSIINNITNNQKYNFDSTQKVKQTTYPINLFTTQQPVNPIPNPTLTFNQFTQQQDNAHQDQTLSWNIDQHQAFESILPQAEQSEVKMIQVKQQTVEIGLPVSNDADIYQYQRLQAIEWMKLNQPDLERKSQIENQEKAYYEKKYRISQYQELPICVVVPSYNNAEDFRHFKNMNSILMQEYSNYHIVFIDDASTDQTGYQIKLLLEQQQMISQQRYIVIQNQEQQLAMINLRKAAKSYCKPQEIFIIVDGDDELLGRQVFKLFNAIFQKQQIWYMYTNFINVVGNVGYSRAYPSQIIDNNQFRKYPFVTSHLRAFYTQLFLNIKEKDLRDQNGAYFRAANDVAICLPILQQAHKRIIYAPELTYVYNSNTGMNNHLLRLRQQKKNDKNIRKKSKYSPLEKIFET